MKSAATTSLLQIPTQKTITTTFPFTTQTTLTETHYLQTHNNHNISPPITINRHIPPRFSRPISKSSSASATTNTMATGGESSTGDVMKLLFVEMGVGYDQHGQDITAAAMRACRDAICSNSIPAFRRGSIPGVSFEQMKLRIKLGVPRSLQQSLDIEKVKSVFPYGKIIDVEVVEGGLICSSGVHVEEMGDKNDDCYIVNAAVYVGY